MGEKPLTDPDTYCRAIETYLCRKNDGRLIRIVGPAFDLVRGWAERGIPLTVVFRGIDHRVERLASADRRHRRRRPLRIEFCDDDVLDVFDEWRRAVGVRVDSSMRGARAEDEAAEEGGPRTSLPAHLQRAIARLTSLRGSSNATPVDRGFLDGLVRELDTMLAGARSLRGERREDALRRLAALDAALGAWAAQRLSADALALLRREAEQELAPFRERMPEAAYARSLDACRTRLVRERAGVPRLTLE